MDTYKLFNCCYKIFGMLLLLDEKKKVLHDEILTCLSNEIYGSIENELV